MFLMTFKRIPVSDSCVNNFFLNCILLVKFKVKVAIKVMVKVDVGMEVS